MSILSNGSTCQSPRTENASLRALLPVSAPGSELNGSLFPCITFGPLNSRENVCVCVRRHREKGAARRECMPRRPRITEDNCLREMGPGGPGVWGGNIFGSKVFCLTIDWYGDGWYSNRIWGHGQVGTRGTFWLFRIFSCVQEIYFVGHRTISSVKSSSKNCHHVDCVQ